MPHLVPIIRILFRTSLQSIGSLSHAVLRAPLQAPCGPNLVIMILEGSAKGVKAWI